MPVAAKGHGLGNLRPSSQNMTPQRSPGISSSATGQLNGASDRNFHWASEYCGGDACSRFAFWRKSTIRNTACDLRRCRLVAYAYVQQLTREVISGGYTFVTRYCWAHLPSLLFSAFTSGSISTTSSRIPFSLPVSYSTQAPFTQCRSSFSVQFSP